MILLYTDFTFNGPYLGQLKAAIYQNNTEAQIIDLMHDVPSFDVKHSAYLLNSLVEYFPDGSVFCCVIDPEVGSKREAIALKIGEQYFIGPDNGIFEYLLRSKKDTQGYKIIWKPKTLSTTFHGRDIFAPIAANISKNDFSGLKSIPLSNLKRFDWSNNLFEVIYIDAYGNMMTGISASAIDEEDILGLAGIKISFAKTYSDMHKDTMCWYINSNQLVEIALRERNASETYSCKIGAVINLIK